MELNINSPAYFKDHYGIDDEVYRFCQRAYMYFRDKEYSDVLHTIGIVPVVAPKELYDGGAWKESCKWRGYNSCAAINIRMDFESYYNADSEEKVKLIKEMILKDIFQINHGSIFTMSWNLDGIESLIMRSGTIEHILILRWLVKIGRI